MDRIVELDNKLNKIDSYTRVGGNYFVNLLIDSSLVVAVL